MKKTKNEHSAFFTKLRYLKDIFYDKYKLHLRLIKRDIILTLQFPFEYPFTLFDSAKETVDIMPYDPQSAVIGNRIVGEVRKQFPDLDVCFHGSSALGIIGQYDIDIIIICKPSEFKRFIPELTTLFGNPKVIKRNRVYWQFKIEKYSVEIMLSDINYRMTKRALFQFSKLNSNKVLLKEYEAMKAQSIGVSRREYEKRKFEFYKKLISA